MRWPVPVCVLCFSSLTTMCLCSEMYHSDSWEWGNGIFFKYLYFVSIEFASIRRCIFKIPLMMSNQTDSTKHYYFASYHVIVIYGMNLIWLQLYRIERSKNTSLSLVMNWFNFENIKVHHKLVGWKIQFIEQNVCCIQLRMSNEHFQQCLQREFSASSNVFFQQIHK